MHSNSRGHSTIHSRNYSELSLLQMIQLFRLDRWQGFIIGSRRKRMHSNHVKRQLQPSKSKNSYRGSIDYNLRCLLLTLSHAYHPLGSNCPCVGPRVVLQLVVHLLSSCLKWHISYSKPGSSTTRAQSWLSRHPRYSIPAGPLKGNRVLRSRPRERDRDWIRRKRGLLPTRQLRRTH